MITNLVSSVARMSALLIQATLLLNGCNMLYATRDIAEKNHSSVAGLHTFFASIPDPKLNEFYGILRELKELDNDTVGKVIDKLVQFEKENMKPAENHRDKLDM